MSDTKDNPKVPDGPQKSSAIETANAVESMSDEQLMKMLEESRIVIRPSGEVVIENLTAGMLEVAYELNPSNPGIACHVDGDDPPTADQGPADQSSVPPQDQDESAGDDA